MGPPAPSSCAEALSKGIKRFLKLDGGAAPAAWASPARGRLRALARGLAGRQPAGQSMRAALRRRMGPPPPSSCLGALSKGIKRNLKMHGGAALGAPKDGKKRPLAACWQQAGKGSGREAWRSRKIGKMH